MVQLHTCQSPWARHQHHTRTRPQINQSSIKPHGLYYCRIDRIWLTFERVDTVMNSLGGRERDDRRHARTATSSGRLICRHVHRPHVQEQHPQSTRGATPQGRPPCAPESREHRPDRLRQAGRRGRPSLKGAGAKRSEQATSVLQKHRQLAHPAIVSGEHQLANSDPLLSS